MRKNNDTTTVLLQCVEEPHNLNFKWVGKPEKAIGYLMGAVCGVLKDVGIDGSDEDRLERNAEGIKQLVIQTLKRQK